jgi:hypothetical protein
LGPIGVQIAGPVDWVWKRLAYQRNQPFLRTGGLKTPESFATEMAGNPFGVFGR